MPDDQIDYALSEHTQYIEERKGLIDAARESSRTFDKAALTFGSAIFGASIAFVKDVAPKPQLYTLKWLGASWTLFSLGLLCVMLSFLFSHKACIFEIDEGREALGKPEREPKKNRWSLLTTSCNYLCVGFFFVGLLSWSTFAFENLGTGKKTVNNPASTPTQVQK